MSNTIAIRGQLESSHPHPDFDGKYQVTFTLDEPGSSVLMHGTGSVLVIAIPPTDPTNFPMSDDDHAAEDADLQVKMVKEER